MYTDGFFSIFIYVFNKRVCSFVQYEKRRERGKSPPIHVRKFRCECERQCMYVQCTYDCAVNLDFKPLAYV